MFQLPQGRPAIMGILNVTPDSFSDGGEFLDVDAAISHARRMILEGADLIDVGGESTRPGADPVRVEEEIRRVVPVVRVLSEEGIPVSIDTAKHEVAVACLELGAQVVNDVTAFSDPEMAKVCRDSNCTICLMHMQGSPRTMQESPQYNDVVQEVRQFLAGRAALLEAAGIDQSRIWIDPGIGFGKTVDHNLALLRGLGELVATGYPVLLGVSRKSFIGKILGKERTIPPSERIAGSLAFQAAGQLAGARILRVHDVRPARDVVECLARLEPSSLVGGLLEQEVVDQRGE